MTWAMLLVSALAAPVQAETPVWDSKGYIYFCPCMGRFGNQMEYYLGVMKLAKVRTGAAAGAWRDMEHRPSLMCVMCDVWR